jgi:hypothetical protein
MRRCARRSPAGTSPGWRLGRGRAGCCGVTGVRSPAVPRRLAPCWTWVPAVASGCPRLRRRRWPPRRGRPACRWLRPGCARWASRWSRMRAWRTTFRRRKDNRGRLPARGRLGHPGVQPGRLRSSPAGSARRRPHMGRSAPAAHRDRTVTKPPPYSCPPHMLTLDGRNIALARPLSPLAVRLLLKGLSCTYSDARCGAPGITSSSAARSAASAAPIRRKISSACLKLPSALAVWPSARAHRPRPASP